MAPRTWFVAGCSGALGRRLSELLLLRGDRVAVATRDPRSVADLANRFADRLWRAELDITDVAALRHTVAQAFSDLGRIDVVVSNIGYLLFGAAEEVSDQQLLQQLNVNLVGGIQLVRAVIPFLRDQRGGRLIQVSSPAAQLSSAGASLYHATKWGIEGFLESVAKELVDFGVRITLVEPGPADADLTRPGLDLAPPFTAYDGTPVDRIRRASTSSGAPLDATRVATAIIEVAEAPSPPTRLVLGGAAWQAIRHALSDRLRDLVTQRDIAFSVDAAPVNNERMVESTLD